IGELLGFLEDSSSTADAESVEAVNIREIRRAHHRATRLPRRLLTELAKVTTLAHHEWAFARRDADFARFRPWLDKIIGLKRRRAEALGYAASPYDALLEEYEPGATRTGLAALFAELRGAPVPLVGAIANSGGASPDDSILHRNYPLDRQRAFGEMTA